MIVETGTGITNANSYASIAEADAYAELTFNNDWLSLLDDDKEKRLILAARFLDRLYTGQWLGIRKTSTQGLSWPRIGVRSTVSDVYGFIVYGLTDNDGYSLEDKVPTRVKEAVYELSKNDAATSYYPQVSSSTSNLKSESITVGSVAIAQTFADSQSVDTTRAIPAEVEDLVAPLINDRGSSIQSFRRY